MAKRLASVAVSATCQYGQAEAAGELLADPDGVLGRQHERDAAARLRGDRLRRPPAGAWPVMAPVSPEAEVEVVAAVGVGEVRAASLRDEEGEAARPSGPSSSSARPTASARERVRRAPDSAGATPRTALLRARGRRRRRRRSGNIAAQYTDARTVPRRATSARESIEARARGGTVRGPAGQSPARNADSASDAAWTRARCASSGGTETSDDGSGMSMASSAASCRPADPRRSFSAPWAPSASGGRIDCETRWPDPGDRGPRPSPSRAVRAPRRCARRIVRRGERIAPEELSQVIALGDVVAIFVGGEAARSDVFSAVEAEPRGRARGDLLEGPLLVAGRRHGFAFVDRGALGGHALACRGLRIVFRSGAGPCGPCFQAFFACLSRMRFRCHGPDTAKAGKYPNSQHNPRS